MNHGLNLLFSPNGNDIGMRLLWGPYELDHKPTRKLLKLSSLAPTMTAGSPEPWGVKGSVPFLERTGKLEGECRILSGTRGGGVFILRFRATQFACVPMSLDGWNVRNEILLLIGTQLYAHLHAQHQVFTPHSKRRTSHLFGPPLGKRLISPVRSPFRGLWLHPIVFRVLQQHLRLLCFLTLSRQVIASLGLRRSTAHGETELSAFRLLPGLRLAEAGLRALQFETKLLRGRRPPEGPK